MYRSSLYKKISIPTVSGMLVLIVAQIFMFLAFDIVTKPDAIVDYAVTFIIQVMLIMVTRNYIATLSKENAPNRYYLSFLITLSLYSFSIAVNCTVPPEPEYVLLKNIAMTVFCLLGFYFAVIYTLFYMQFYGMSKKLERVVRVLLFLSYAIVAAVILTNPLTHLLFVVGADGSFEYSDTFFIINIYLVIWAAYNIYFIFRSKNTLSTKFALFSYIIFVLIALIIDFMPERENAVHFDSHFALGIFFSVYVVFARVYLQNKIELGQKNIELQNKQTQIMVSQIQPHFLFNTLSAIYVLCEKDPKLAKKTIKEFSTYLRHNINSLKTNECVPFDKELSHTRTYLKIEKLRFGDILNVDYDIEVTDFMIPPLTLQPIVENAVKYGVRSCNDGGTVTIGTQRQNGQIIITVHDTGKGFDTRKASDDDKEHVGIENTRYRIESMCNGKMTIDSSEEKGTTVTITLEDMR